MSYVPDLPANFDCYNPNPKLRRDNSLVCGNCDDMFYPEHGQGFLPTAPEDNPYNYRFCDPECFLSFTKVSQNPPIYEAIADRVVQQVLRTVEPYGDPSQLLSNGGTKTMAEYKGNIQMNVFYEGGEKRVKVDNADMAVTLPEIPEEHVIETQWMLQNLGQPQDDDMEL